VLEQSTVLRRAPLSLERRSNTEFLCKGTRLSTALSEPPRSYDGCTAAGSTNLLESSYKITQLTKLRLLCEKIVEAKTDK